MVDRNENKEGTDLIPAAPPRRLQIEITNRVKHKSGENKDATDLIPTAPPRSIHLKVVLRWVRFAPQVDCFHNNIPDDGDNDEASNAPRITTRWRMTWG